MHHCQTIAMYLKAKNPNQKDNFSKRKGLIINVWALTNMDELLDVNILLSHSESHNLSEKEVAGNQS